MAAIEEKKENVKENVKENEESKISILLEDLTSLESYARDLFSFLPLPVCLISSMGIILDVNPAFESISGYKAEEIIGSSAEEIFKEKEIKKLFKETLEKGFLRGKETVILTKEKKEIPVNISTTLRKTEKEEIIGYFLGFFDLSEIKQREKELKDIQAALTNILEDIDEAWKKAEEEKNKTLTIINNFADGLLVFDSEDRVSLVNPQAESFFELKANDLIGKTVSELKTFPSLKLLIDFLESKVERIFRKELSIRENLILEVSTVPLVKKDGIEIGSLVILHNITREKMIDRMKTEFVSLSAHQLRTPLSAIKWTLRMLLDGDLGEITKEQREFIEKTYNSNERMVNLINDLLDLTRIEEGRYVYKPTPVEIEPIIELIVNSYKEELERRKLKLKLKKPKEKLPRVIVDVEKIKLVIQNFIENAMKYTLAGGKITISLKCHQKEIEFSVKDSGVGIPEDQKERVFAKFFRGANVVRMDTEGTGLGLFISKNIIEAHGGRIWFESKENKGSIFYFTLPIKKTKEEFEEFLKEL